MTTETDSIFSDTTLRFGSVFQHLIVTVKIIILWYLRTREFYWMATRFKTSIPICSIQFYLRLKSNSSVQRTWAMRLSIMKTCFNFVQNKFCVGNYPQISEWSWVKFMFFWRFYNSFYVTIFKNWLNTFRVQ